MYVVPKKGYSIRDPELLDLLPSGGREVVSSDYWLRRLADRDVLLGRTDQSAQGGASPNGAAPDQGETAAPSSGNNKGKE